MLSEDNGHSNPKLKFNFLFSLDGLLSMFLNENLIKLYFYISILFSQIIFLV